MLKQIKTKIKKILSIGPLTLLLVYFKNAIIYLLIHLFIFFLHPSQSCYCLQLSLIVSCSMFMEGYIGGREILATWNKNKRT